MNYYRYSTNCDEYEVLDCQDGDYDRLKGTLYQNLAISAHWKPIQFIAETPSRKCLAGDFAAFAGSGRIVVMTDRARRAIEPLLDERYEFLEGRHPNGYVLWILHMMEEVDCLDKKRVQGSWNVDRFTWIHKFALHFDKIGDRHIFRLPLGSGSDVLVDDVFRETVEKHKLTGLHFKPLPMVD